MGDIRQYEEFWSQVEIRHLPNYEPAQKIIRLNLGCAGNYMSDGFINLDKDYRSFSGYGWSERAIVGNGLSLPFSNNSFYFVLMSHVLEHSENPFRLMDEVWRVLMPGGHVLIVVPHGMSNIQLSTPSHVSAYIPETFSAFQSSRYEKIGDHGYKAFEGKQVHPWEIVRIDQEAKIKLPTWLLRKLAPYFWNLFSNLYCVMRKPYGQRQAF